MLGLLKNAIVVLRFEPQRFNERYGSPVSSRAMPCSSHPEARPSLPKDGGVESHRAVSGELERWLDSEGEKTLGSVISLFGEKSFAVLFILLLGVSALPLPTGGATHVFEIIAILLGLQLIAGRDEIWLPARWRNLRLAGEKQRGFISRLMKMIRWLERFSRPRLSFVFNRRLSNIAFGLLTIAGSLGAFVAPPFSGLDTLPSLGVVLLSLGVLLEDIVIVLVAITVGVAGVVLELVLGSAAFHGIGQLF